MTIQKATKIQSNEISENELAIINQYTMTELKAEDIFAFKAVLCDNQIDRDIEAFSVDTLKQLAGLFIGKPIIKDHHPEADNQIARIYRTEVEESETDSKLIAYCYMIRTESNADFIKEIQGGIKKEGSVGCAIQSRKCSVCGTDWMKTKCKHVLGRKYKGQICHAVLSNALDAYEFSLVAIPAQRNAGVHKNFDDTAEKQQELAIRSRLASLTVGIYNFEEDLNK